MTHIGTIITIVSALIGLIIGLSLKNKKFRKYLPKKLLPKKIRDEIISEEKIQEVLDKPELLLEKLKIHGDIYDAGHNLEVSLGENGVEINKIKKKQDINEEIEKKIVKSKKKIINKLKKSKSKNIKVSPQK